MKQILLWVPLLLILLTACGPVVEDIGPTSTLKYTPSPSSTASPTHTATAQPTATSTATTSPTPVPGFSFVVTSDMSHYSAQEYINYPNFFAALLSYVYQFGPGDFMVSTGDVIPAEGTDWTIDQILGVDYPWFPLPGNHDFGTAEINFFEAYDFDSTHQAGPKVVRWGPEPCSRSTYSFDFRNAHFVALNVYCNADAPWGIDGSVTDTVYEWLADDLAATDQPLIFVFGHEPAFPQADVETGQARHINDSLNQYPEARDRFWALLQASDVVAYIHGHTHTYSAVEIDGVWQIDAGQAMGVRAAPSPGTFLIFSVQGELVSLETYRGEDGPGFTYDLYEEILIRP